MSFSSSRLFAVADLHGDLAQAEAALRLCGLLSPSGRWDGGNATLVQTGDLLDRGPQSRELLALFRGLEAEAQAHGGRVLRLLGNHEVLNLEGDVRYVSPDELETAGGQAVWSALFDPLHGKLGQELRQHRVAVVVGSGPCRTLFVHAGLHPDMLRPNAEGSSRSTVGREAGLGMDSKDVASSDDLLADINQRMHEALGHAREAGSAFTGLTGDNGPVWYRGFAVGNEALICSALRTTLEAVGAWRMVVGHTIVPGHTHALSRCGGLLHMIDVGMSRAYYGSLAAWTCEPRGSGDATLSDSVRTQRIPDKAIHQASSRQGATPGVRRRLAAAESGSWASVLPLYPGYAVDSVARAYPLQAVFQRRPNHVQVVSERVASGITRNSDGARTPTTVLSSTDAGTDLAAGALPFDEGVLVRGKIVKWELERWRAANLAAELRLPAQGARRVPTAGHDARTSLDLPHKAVSDGPMGPTMRWLEEECLQHPDCMGFSVEGVAGVPTGRRRRGAAESPPEVFWWQMPSDFHPDSNGLGDFGMLKYESLAASKVSGYHDGPHARLTELSSPAGFPWWLKLFLTWVICVSLAAIVCHLWRRREIAAGRHLRVVKPKRPLSRSSSTISLGRVELGDEDCYHSE